jgi:hypothetical protein
LIEREPGNGPEVPDSLPQRHKICHEIHPSETFAVLSTIFTANAPEYDPLCNEKRFS